MKVSADKDQIIAQLQTQLAQQSAVIDQLKEALILERHRRFAKLNEALRSLQGELFNEVEQASIEDEVAPSDDDTVTVPAHQRKRGGRKPLPADLPRIDVIHDLADEGKVLFSRLQRSEVALLSQGIVIIFGVFMTLIWFGRFYFLNERCSCFYLP